MPINRVIGISAEREMGYQLFMVTATIFWRLWARRLPAVRERPSAIRLAPRAPAAPGVLASALGELNPLLQRIHP